MWNSNYTNFFDNLIYNYFFPPLNHFIIVVLIFFIIIFVSYALDISMILSFTPHSIKFLHFEIKTKGKGWKGAERLPNYVKIFLHLYNQILR
jgi:hypothetical protein